MQIRHAISCFLNDHSSDLIIPQIQLTRPFGPTERLARVRLELRPANAEW